MADQERKAAQARDEAATAAPRSVVLGGKTYLVAQLTPADLTAVKGHLSRRARSPLAQIAEDLAALPPELQKVAVAEAARLQAGGGANMTEEGAFRLLHTPEAVRFLAWLMVRRHHPEVTQEEIAAHVSEANVDAVMMELSEASGLEGLGGNSRGRPGSPAKG